jgi:hypothetical protein
MKPATAIWAMERANRYRSLLLEAQIMSADTIHAALGLTFTAIWLLVGQILVANRQDG